MLKRLRESHPGYLSEQKTFEEYAPAAIAENKKFGSILALYGAATYFDIESYENVERLMNPDGNYFLMFYRPGYYPEHLYSAEEIDLIKSKQNYAAISVAFENKYLFSKYLVATNLQLDLEVFQL